MDNTLLSPQKAKAPSPAASDGVRQDWQSVMTPEEMDEFGAIQIALNHAQEAAKALSLRRAKIRNRLVARLNWRKTHVVGE